MTYKYGVFQSTSKSCIFYKEDEDGNQSTFNIFITTANDENKINKIFAYIDNEQMKKDNWSVFKEQNLKEVLEAFGTWALDAPLLFELEAHNSMKNCLSSFMKKEE